MSRLFSLNQVRVSVSRDTLEKIADLLKVPKTHRDRILKGGLFIAPPAAAGGSAPAPSRAQGGRSSAASRTASGAAARSTSRTTRRRK